MVSRIADRQTDRLNWCGRRFRERDAIAECGKQRWQTMSTVRYQWWLDAIDTSPLYISDGRTAVGSRLDNMTCTGTGRLRANGNDRKRAHCTRFSAGCVTSLSSRTFCLKCLRVRDITVINRAAIVQYRGMIMLSTIRDRRPPLSGRKPRL